MVVAPIRLNDVHRGVDRSSVRRLVLGPSPTEAKVLRMLSMSLRRKRTHFVVPRSQPIDLIDLHAIFKDLQRKHMDPAKEMELVEKVPLHAFQRAFERLFFLLGDKEKFDAEFFDLNGDGAVTWEEFYRVHKQRAIAIRRSLLERLYLVFTYPDACILASIVSTLVLITIVISSSAFVFSTLPVCHVNPEACNPFEVVEKCCLAIFVAEYLVRLLTVPAACLEVHDKAHLHELVVGDDPVKLRSPLHRLLHFIFAPANMLDLWAILPGVVGLFVEADGGAFVVLRLVRLTRVFRAFKSPAIMVPAIVIGRTMQQSSKVLYQLAFNLCLGIVIFGALIYTVEGGSDLSAFNVGGRWVEELQAFERRVGGSWGGGTGVRWERSPFQSIPDSFWWAIVTATTVGFGDHYPTTPLGYLVALLLMVFGMVILALPVGVMGETFSKEWAKFQMEKTEKAKMWEESITSITSGIFDLDPVNVAPLLLVEVWHDHPSLPVASGDEPPACTFLGQAKIEMCLRPDRVEEQELRVPLEANHDLVKRSVSGHLTLRYRWTPRNCRPAMARMFTSRVCAEDFDIKGSLDVTVVSAEGLINLGMGGCKSSPYCTVLYHPVYATRLEGPRPEVWRTATVADSLCPRWNAARTLEVDWASELERMPELAKSPMASGMAFALKTDTVSPAPPVAAPPVFSPLDEVSQMLGVLTREMRQRRAEAQYLRERVQRLASHQRPGGPDGGEQLLAPSGSPTHVSVLLCPDGMDACSSVSDCEWT